MNDKANDSDIFKNPDLLLMRTLEMIQQKVMNQISDHKGIAHGKN